MDKKVLLKFTRDCGQTKPNTKTPKNPDVPRKNYDPKNLMNTLPTKNKK